MNEEKTYRGLRRFNAVMGVLHLLQGIAVLALSNGFGIPVVAAYADGPPGADKPAPEVLFDLNIGLAVAVFLFLSALFHFLIISPPFVDRYIGGLDQKRNNFRWVEYSLSSSVMIVLVISVGNGRPSMPAFDSSKRCWRKKSFPLPPRNAPHSWLIRRFPMPSGSRC